MGICLHMHSALLARLCQSLTSAQLDRNYNYTERMCDYTTDKEGKNKQENTKSCQETQQQVLWRRQRSHNYRHIYCNHKIGAVITNKKGWTDVLIKPTGVSNQSNQDLINHYWIITIIITLKVKKKQLLKLLNFTPAAVSTTWRMDGWSLHLSLSEVEGCNFVFSTRSSEL